MIKILLVIIIIGIVVAFSFFNSSNKIMTDSGVEAPLTVSELQMAEERHTAPGKEVESTLNKPFDYLSTPRPGDSGKYPEPNTY